MIDPDFEIGDRVMTTILGKNECVCACSTGQNIISLASCQKIVAVTAEQ